METNIRCNLHTKRDSIFRRDAHTHIAYTYTHMSVFELLKEIVPPEDVLAEFDMLVLVKVRVAGHQTRELLVGSVHEFLHAEDVSTECLQECYTRSAFGEKTYFEVLTTTSHPSTNQNGHDRGASLEYTIMVPLRALPKVRQGLHHTPARQSIATDNKGSHTTTDKENNSPTQQERMRII